jgi:hypothetical protein
MKILVTIFGTLGLLCVSSGIPAAANTINLSTGTATYTITSDTNGGVDADYTGPAITVTNLATNWLPNSITDGIGDSGVWVAPAADQANANVPGTVSGVSVYDTTFSLAGLNPATALLTMNLTGDDVVSVTLNGNTIFTPTAGEEAGNFWSAAVGTFTVNDSALDFTAGANTLVFTVDNFPGDGASSTNGPTGLDVAASVSASAVPEPSSALPLALAILAGGFFLRRRTASAR